MTYCRQHAILYRPFPFDVSPRSFVFLAQLLCLLIRAVVSDILVKRQFKHHWLPNLYATMEPSWRSLGGLEVFRCQRSNLLKWFTLVRLETSAPREWMGKLWGGESFRRASPLLRRCTLFPRATYKVITRCRQCFLDSELEVFKCPTQDFLRRCLSNPGSYLSFLSHNTVFSAAMLPFSLLLQK